MDKDRLRALIEDGDVDYIYEYIQTTDIHYSKEIKSLENKLKWTEYFQTYFIWVLGIVSFICLCIYGLNYYRKVDNAHTKMYLIKADNCFKNNNMSDCLYVIDQTEDKEIRYILKQKLSNFVVK